MMYIYIHIYLNILGDTYFFSENQYWKFNHHRNKTEDGYPKNAAEFLLGCKT